eukprot:TRINITY_DN1087_c1_g1_i1.p1 TRINITY_DN1087_c1_g1~~TRINITY_DN1087_c1_g1_i1.p1  ORF type:complete len:262 (+),score=73.94 TRINITY_DN1087_c1_g1_i1:48-788(+)
MAVPFSRPASSTASSPSERRRRRELLAGGQRDLRSALPLAGSSLDSLGLTSRITFYALYEAWRLLQEVTRSLSNPSTPPSSPQDTRQQHFPQSARIPSPPSSSKPEKKPQVVLNEDLPEFPNTFGRQEYEELKVNPSCLQEESTLWREVGGQILEVTSSFEITYGEERMPSNLKKTPEDLNSEASCRALFDSYLIAKQSVMKSDLTRSRLLALERGPPLIIFLSYSKTALRQLLLSTLWFLLKKVL